MNSPTTELISDSHLQNFINFLARVDAQKRHLPAVEYASSAAYKVLINAA